MEDFELKEEDYVCANCKYYGCDRSKNCDTICDKWSISDFILEDLIEERYCSEQVEAVLNSYKERKVL